MQFEDKLWEWPVGVVNAGTKGTHETKGVSAAGDVSAAWDIDAASSKLIDIEESQLWILENGAPKMDYHSSDRRKNKIQVQGASQSCTKRAIDNKSAILGQ
jgi:hypothetical protein